MEIRKLIAAATGHGAVFTSMAYAADADNKPSPWASTRPTRP